MKEKHSIIGKMLIKLPFNWYILRPHKSDHSFLYYRSRHWLKEYFGEALNENGEREMMQRRCGFEDGYLECLKDLGIKLTYPKTKK